MFVLQAPHVIGAAVLPGSGMLSETFRFEQKTPPLADSGERESLLPLEILEF